MLPSFGSPDAVVHYCPPWAAQHEKIAEELEAPRCLQVSIPPSTVHGLFAHRQWRSGLLLADFIASGVIDVRGRTVLELGAGTGLPGIVSALAGARSVTTTDYDEETIIRRLRANVNANVPEEGRRGNRMRVLGHTWGTAAVDDLLLWDSQTRTSLKFDTVLCADLLWDRFSHQDLVSTLREVLHNCTPGEISSEIPAVVPRVHLIAGLHTGREVVSQFFRLAEAAGFAVEGVNGDTIVYEWAVTGDGTAEVYTSIEDAERAHQSEGDRDGSSNALRSGLAGQKRPFNPQLEESVSERNEWVIRATLRWKR